MKLRTVQWITIVGSVAGVIGVLLPWDSEYRWIIAGATIALMIGTGLLEVQRDRLSVLFAGIRRYDRSFPIENNVKMFQTVQAEYCYLGVSFATVLSSFREWYGSSDRRANTRITILLTDPAAQDLLEFQARYERNLWDEPLIDADRKTINDVVRRVRDSITLTIDTLTSLPSSGPPIEIYFHRERIRKWIHIVDRAVLYEGMLQMGSDGLRAPVLQLQSRPGKWRLFDYHQEEWESIKRTAQRVQPEKEASAPAHLDP